MFDNYLQQTTSADVIFQMHFFLAALRVKCTENITPESSLNIYQSSYGNISNFSLLSFCKRILLFAPTPLCICSVCVHYVGKVLD